MTPDKKQTLLLAQGTEEFFLSAQLGLYGQLFCPIHNMVE
jgi:hypothetical protein